MDLLFFFSNSFNIVFFFSNSLKIVFFWGGVKRRAPQVKNLAGKKMGAPATVASVHRLGLGMGWEWG